MDLVATINSRLEALGWQQKQLAHEWHAAVGSGKVSTFETRLSKLVNREAEGLEFLVDEKEGDARREGLATALGVPRDTVEQLVGRERELRTLLLHPRLPSATRAFLERRGLRPDAPFRVRPVDDPSLEPRDALNVAARKAWRPLVVLPDSRDEDFFHGARVPTTQVRATERGFELIGAPELTKPKPPLLFDADGMPMIPDEENEKGARKAIALLDGGDGRSQWGSPPTETPWTRAVREADDDCRTVTFRLDWFVKAPDADEFKRVVLAWVAEHLRPHNRSGYSCSGFLWVRENRVLAIGPNPPRRAAVAAHHEVADVTAVPALVRKLVELAPTVNPDGLGGQLDVDTELDALAEETGIRIEISRDDLRTLVRPERRMSFEESGCVRRDAAADAAWRALLDRVLARDFAAAPWLVFELEAVRRSSLLHEAEGRVAVANIGAGNVVRLEVEEFPGEPAIAFRGRTFDPRYKELPSTVLDGGDIRLTIGRSVHRTLEGTILVAPGRRREEEARAAASDDWDDD